MKIIKMSTSAMHSLFQIGGWFLLIMGISTLMAYTGGLILTNLNLYWGCDDGVCSWISYSDEDLADIRPSLPAFASFIIWTCNILYSLICLLSGRQLIQLSHIVKIQGVMCEEVSNKTRNIIGYFAFLLLAKTISEKLFFWYEFHLIDINFILDILVYIVIVVLIYSLTDVLLKAIDLKVENDLTI